MTVQKIKLAGRQFVIIPEKDFRNLERRAKSAYPRQKGSDRADIALARKRLSDPKEKPIPYEQARKVLGLS